MSEPDAIDMDRHESDAEDAAHINGGEDHTHEELAAATEPGDRPSRDMSMSSIPGRHERDASETGDTVTDDSEQCVEPRAPSGILCGSAGSDRRVSQRATRQSWASIMEEEGGSSDGGDLPGDGANPGIGETAIS